ncbi:MAG: tyrosine-type recombinase/integrase [Chloroflexi bacterium]|nr:tyrosine-type recombinase/integrase [Chloroflexota bacterium]
MTEDDLSVFLDAVQETPYYVLFYTALLTGMRRSELLALRWSDLDLLLCQAHVTRSLHRLRTGEIILRTTISPGLQQAAAIGFDKEVLSKRGKEALAKDS